LRTNCAMAVPISSGLFHLHEARQGSPPFNPAQDQLGRHGMVGGEDGLADFLRVRHEIHSPASGSSTAPG
jgi:hypothetical protein